MTHVEKVERSSEYHACLFVQKCVPAKVRPMRSRCIERVFRKGTDGEFRRVY